MKSWERVTTWSSLKASQQALQNRPAAGGTLRSPSPKSSPGRELGGAGNHLVKLGSRLHTWQVLSAADKRSGRWGDFDGGKNVEAPVPT